MFTIPIQGLNDGKHEIHLTCNADTLAGIFPEFKSAVMLDGVLTRIGHRLTFVGVASSDATLVCDYSLQEFTERLSAPLELSFVMDTSLYLERQRSGEDEVYEIHALREDAHGIDLSDEVAQELSVSLPLKRVAPQYRDKTFEEIIGDEHIKERLSESTNEDERWSALKNIHFNN